MKRALASRLLLPPLVVLGLALPFAALGQGPPGPPGPGPGGPPGPKGPGPGGPPGGPAGGPVNPAETLRKIQQLRAQRLKQMLRNDATAALAIDALDQHENRSRSNQDKKTEVLAQIEKVVAALMQAKVEAVKNDEVIIDVGSDQKVAAGWVFLLRHQGKVVGKALVEKVSETNCVAKATLEKGEKVVKDDPCTFAGMDMGKPEEASEAEKQKKTGELPALLEKLASLQKDQHAADEGLQKKLGEVLKPEQVAQVVIFVEQFEKEIKKILEQAAAPGGK